MIFDTHAHYDDEAFDEDREQLLASFKENGIDAVTNVAASLPAARLHWSLPETMISCMLH